MLRSTDPCHRHSRSTRLRRPDPPRLRVVPAVLRIAENRPRAPRPRVGRQCAATARPALAPPAPPTSSCGSKSTTARGSPGEWPPICDARVASPATTCAFVTTSPGPATQPLPSIRARRRSRAPRTTLATGRSHPPARRIPRDGAATSAAGPVHRRQRVEAGQRIAGSAPTAAAARSAPAGSPTAGCPAAAAVEPADRARSRRRSRRSRGRRSRSGPRPPPRRSTMRSPGSPKSARARSPIPSTRSRAPPRRAARRPGRTAARTATAVSAGQNQRPAACRERPEREPDERQHTDDEALEIAVEREHQR